MQLPPRFGDIQAQVVGQVVVSFGCSSIPPRPTSCPYFERDDMTLQDAQLAKIDLMLSELRQVTTAT